MNGGVNFVVRGPQTAFTDEDPPTLCGMHTFVLLQPTAAEPDVDTGRKSLSSPSSVVDVGRVPPTNLRYQVGGLLVSISKRVLTLMRRANKDLQSKAVSDAPPSTPMRLRSGVRVWSLNLLQTRTQLIAKI
nr:unnamed protein product [Spirometra erinaceieuropaei]